MTKDEAKLIRKTLGYSTAEMARALGLGRYGSRTIERIEAGAPITGPMALAIQKLRDDQLNRE